MLNSFTATNRVDYVTALKMISADNDASDFTFPSPAATPKSGIANFKRLVLRVSQSSKAVAAFGGRGVSINEVNFHDNVAPSSQGGQDQASFNLAEPAVPARSGIVNFKRLVTRVSQSTKILNAFNFGSDKRNEYLLHPESITPYQLPASSEPPVYFPLLSESTASTDGIAHPLFSFALDSSADFLIEGKRFPNVLAYLHFVKMQREQAKSNVTASPDSQKPELMKNVRRSGALWFLEASYESVLWQALRCKFQQHHMIRRRLLAREGPLVAVGRDQYWGTGHNFPNPTAQDSDGQDDSDVNFLPRIDGYNRVGVVLQRLRDELREYNADAPQSAEHRRSLSQRHTMSMTMTEMADLAGMAILSENNSINEVDKDSSDSDIDSEDDQKPAVAQPVLQPVIVKTPKFSYDPDSEVAGLEQISHELGSRISIDGSWQVSSGSAGGCFPNNNTWHCNPQFKLSWQNISGTAQPETPTRIWIRIRRLADSTRRASVEQTTTRRLIPAMGFMVATLSLEEQRIVGRKLSILNSQDVLHIAPLASKQHVDSEFHLDLSATLAATLEAVSTPLPFVIIPYCFNQNTEGDFSLIIRSNRPELSVQECSPFHAIFSQIIGSVAGSTVQGEWRRSLSAGGAMLANSPAFFSNPQFLLRYVFQQWLFRSICLVSFVLLLLSCF